MNSNILYKYQSLNRNTILGLINHSLYAPLPHELNDPFDCFTHIYDKENNDGQLIEDFHIISMTADKTNLLMWSHYGDSHKGICLGFKLDNNDFIFNSANFHDNPYYDRVNDCSKLPVQEVVYCNEEISNPNPEYADPFEEYNYLYYKSNDWSYEKEYRIILNKKYLKRKIVTYPKESLISISFGLYIDVNEREIVINEIRNNWSNSNVRFYQMKRVTGLYKIKSERIKI